MFIVYFYYERMYLASNLPAMHSTLIVYLNNKKVK
jgi:hypothetical protein